MQRRYVIGVWALLMLSSCKQKNQIISASTSVINSQENDMGYQAEALLVDIPVPLYTHRFSSRSNTSSADDLLLGYFSSLSPDTIIDFYKKEMDRLGWECVKTFGAATTLLVFQTPLRLCVISISANKPDQSEIRIYVGSKQSARANDSEQIAQLSSYSMIENDFLTLT